MSKDNIKPLSFTECAKILATLDITDCARCEGSGFEPRTNRKDACHNCGGTGELVSMVMPQDVRGARRTLEVYK